MTAVSVLVPFTSEEPWRQRARDYVVGWYRTLGWEVVEGVCPGPWRKAVAVADAATRASGDILVVADADCVCDDVALAVAAVETGAAWAMPHGRVHRLDVVATEAVYAGIPARETIGRVQRPYRGWPAGGIVALARATWEQIPMDPRFVGWSGEDESWAAALDTLAGPCVRLDRPLFHLWHPPAARLSRRWGSHASRALAGRYRKARFRPAEMAALVGDARSLLQRATV